MVVLVTGAVMLVGVTLTLAAIAAPLVVGVVTMVIMAVV